MGIEDPTPDAAALDPFRRDNEPSATHATPSWADESTVAVPLTELFADDTEEPTSRPW
jgi:hypothetical protein